MTVLAQDQSEKKRRLLLQQPTSGDKNPQPMMATGEPRRQLVTTSAQGASAPPPATRTAEVTAKPVLSNVQDNETVQGQLRGLLDKGNPLLAQSRKRAVTQAASRGLQNSTMAAQAGEEAFISQALPIAAADAQTFGNRALINVDTQNRFGLQKQGGDINSQLQKEQGDISSRLQTEQGDIASRLQGEQGDINSRLQKEQAGYRKEELNIQMHHERVMQDKAFQAQQHLLMVEYGQRMNLSSHESRLQIDRMNTQHAQTLSQIEANASAQTRVNGAQYTQQLGGAYLTAVTNRQSAASAEIQQIYTTQGLTSSQQQAAVQAAYARANADLNTLSAYYRQAPAWDPNWRVSAPTSAPIAGGGMTPIIGGPQGIYDTGGERQYRRSPNGYWHVLNNGRWISVGENRPSGPGWREVPYEG